MSSQPPTAARADIVLAGANAGYIHCALALRCLLANLGPLAARTRLIECDTRDLTPVQWVERLLACRPRVIGFSVYLWNVRFVVETLRLLRRVAPEIALVAGGPQLVPDDPDDEVRRLTDAVVHGEGEGVAAALFAALLEGRRALGAIQAPPPDLAAVALPYALYSDADLATRLTYVESSRGCPFHCAYCTSASSGGIRVFPPERFLPALGDLLDRGARHLKFLDRSFNRGGAPALAVLDFLLTRPLANRILHFEFTPEPLPPEWRQRLLRFPPGALHLEVGVQTWDPGVARRVRRALDRTAVDETLRFLIRDVRAAVHADLIAGLPGETLASFAEGFDHLVALEAAELQVGLLKSLPGTEIRRTAQAEGLVFSPDPPYEILATPELSFEDLQRLARLARCWELLYNRKRFPTAAPRLWSGGRSPCACVLALADRLQARHGRLHALSPARLAEALLEETPPAERPALRAALEHDARLSARAPGI